MNKKWAWIGIGLSLLLIGCSTFLITSDILSNKKKDENKTDSENIDGNTTDLYTYDVKSSEIVFYYKDTEKNKVISTYKCKKADCSIATGQTYSGFDQHTGVALIRDNIIPEEDYKSSYVLFDANKGVELLSSPSINPIFYYSYPEYGLYQPNYVAGYYYTDDNNKISLLYADGTKLFNGHDFDDIYTEAYGTIHLFGKLENLYIGVKKDGKWGVIDFRAHGNLILDYKYDGINLFNSYNIAVKKDNVWSVIGRDKNVVGTGYQEVYIEYEYYLASVNNKVNLYNEKGTMIGNINLDLGLPYNHKVCCGAPTGLYLTKTDNEKILSLVIEYATDKEHDYTGKAYYYDLNTNVLTEKSIN